jgi:hypothetical protein
MRRIIESVIAGVIVAFISKGLGKYGGIDIMRSVYQTFVVELWPIWIGLLGALVYWIVIDYIKVRRFINDLIKWIGYFSYPNKEGGYLYTDLKGKIKQYIKEELEKKSKQQITGDTEKAETLAKEIAKIRTGKDRS